MGTNAEASRQAPSASGDTADDVDLFVRLSGVRADVLRFRQEASAASDHLRVMRTRIAQLDAILGEDTRRLTALQTDCESDRVTVGLLQDAVAGGRSAYESASRDSMQTETALRSSLARVSHLIESLAGDEPRLKGRLSAVGSRTYELLLRRNIAPLVAYLTDGSCGECRWTIPSTAVTSIVLKRGLSRCPYCSRVLVLREPGIPSLR